MHPRLLLCAVCLASVACAPRATNPPAGGNYDVVLSNGHIMDGTGNPWFAGDLAINGDRIARVAPAGGLANARAARRIDATGLVVAPGFIDIQGQSYAAFLALDAAGTPGLKGYGAYDDVWVTDEGEWRLAYRETVMYGHAPAATYAPAIGGAGGAVS